MSNYVKVKHPKRRCETCNVLYVTKTNLQRFCSTCRAPHPCACGCGRLTSKSGAKFLPGHFVLPLRTCAYCKTEFQPLVPRQKWCKPCVSPRKCACGCGQSIKSCEDPKWRYARGHDPAVNAKIVAVRRSNDSYKHTDATRLKMRKSRLNVLKNKPHLQRKLVAALREKFRTDPSYRAKMGMIQRGQSNKQSEPERLLHAALDKRVFKYSGLTNKDYGQPISADIIAPKVKLIVQVDGCYWHECPKHGSGKFPNKRDADKRLTNLAQRSGWTVLRFWEHNIRHSLERVVSTINSKLQELRS